MTDEEGDPPLRLIHPGHSANTGLIADMSVNDGGLTYAIIYRPRLREGIVWIESISPVMIG